MMNVRIGFVGCGTHSTNNLYPMLKYARCSLQAVCDLDQALAGRNAAIFGGKSVYTDAAEMLEKEQLDGVIVVGPPKIHYEVGKKVLEKGIPLFVEKPPAPDLESARDLVRLAKKRGTYVMTGFMKRFALTYAKIRDFISTGRFQPSAGLFRYIHWPGTDLNGILHTMSIHPIDLSVSMLGTPVEVTSAMHEASKALCIALTIRYESGAWAQFVLGCHGPRIQEHVELSGIMDGKHALFIVDDIIHMELHTAGQNGIDVLAPTLAEISPTFDLPDIKMWRPDFGLPNMGQNTTFNSGYAGEIREFVDAILDKRMPHPGNEECLTAMKVIDAVLKKPKGTTKIK